MTQFAFPPPFNTIEGWAIPGAVLWAVLAHFSLLPLTVDIPQFGSVNPAFLLVVGVASMLKNLGVAGSLPFVGKQAVAAPKGEPNA